MKLHRVDRRRAWPALVLGLGLMMSACRADGGGEPEVSATAGHAEQVRIGSIDWYVDYEAAVEVAREQDKALWVHFGENPG